MSPSCFVVVRMPSIRYDLSVPSLSPGTHPPPHKGAKKKVPRTPMGAAPKASSANAAAGGETSAGDVDELMATDTATATADEAPLLGEAEEDAPLLEAPGAEAESEAEGAVEGEEEVKAEAEAQAEAEAEAPPPARKRPTNPPQIGSGPAPKSGGDPLDDLLG